MIPVVKAQLLAFLIYTTPPMLQQQLQAVGQGSWQPEEASEEEQKEPDLAQMLPGPCPVLRRLVAFDPGQTRPMPMPIFAVSIFTFAVAVMRKPDASHYSSNQTCFAITQRPCFCQAYKQTFPSSIAIAHY